jgi:hypothetical protein
MGLLHDVLVGVLIAVGAAAVLGFIACLWKRATAYLEMQKRRWQNREQHIVKLRVDVERLQIGADIAKLRMDRLFSESAEWLKAGPFAAYQQEMKVRLEGRRESGQAARGGCSPAHSTR